MTRRVVRAPRRKRKEIRGGLAPSRFSHPLTASLHLPPSPVANCLFSGRPGRHESGRNPIARNRFIELSVLLALAQLAHRSCACNSFTAGHVPERWLTAPKIPIIPLAFAKAGQASCGDRVSSIHILWQRYGEKATSPGPMTRRQGASWLDHLHWSPLGFSLSSSRNGIN